MISNAIVAPDDDLRFERYLRDSFAGLVARLRDSFSERVAAEDVVQEALIRAWLLEARGEQIRRLEPWMNAAATNLARSWWRTIRAEDRALEQVAADRSNHLSDIFQVPAPSSLPGPLESAIGRLSPRQGQIVVLHYYGDLSVGAIARRLDVSEGTVKRTLHDARAELRRMVGQDQQLQRPRRQTMTGWHMAGSHPSQYGHALADETYEGKRVVELRSMVPRTDGFGTLMQTFSAEHFLGQRVRFSGALKCEGVEHRVGLWMRVDGPERRMLAFDNMAGRPVSGTTDWEHYEVVLDLPDEAQAIALGVLLVGGGEAWMSDFNLEIVGPEVETTDAGMLAALPERPQNLDFAEPLTTARGMGWTMGGSHPSQYEHALADDTTYEGKPVVELRSLVPRTDGFGTLMQMFSAEHYLGQRVRFSGALKCEGVENRVGLWMRVDGVDRPERRTLAFDNMAGRPVSGTTDWEHYEVVLDVPDEAQTIALGVLLNGKGEAWMSDFNVEIVGREVETTDAGMTAALPERPQNLDFSNP